MRKYAKLIDEMAMYYMDNDIREKVHFDLVPCTDKEYLEEYLRRDPGFAEALNEATSGKDWQIRVDVEAYIDECAESWQRYVDGQQARGVSDAKLEMSGDDLANELHRVMDLYAYTPRGARYVVLMDKEDHDLAVEFVPAGAMCLGEESSRYYVIGSYGLEAPVK